MGQELNREVRSPLTTALRSRLSFKARAEVWHKTLPLTLELVVFYLKLQGIHDSVVSVQSGGLWGRHFKVSFDRDGWGLTKRFSLRHFKKTLQAEGVNLEGLYSCDLNWRSPLIGDPLPGAWVGDLFLKSRKPLRVPFRLPYRLP